MPRYGEGWVKDWRLPEDHWLEEDLLVWAIFKKLISWANYKDSAPNAAIILKRGQLVTSLGELADLKIGSREKLGKQRVRTVLAKLQQRASINILTNTRGTIITICNYDKYQSDEDLPTHASTTDQHTINTPSTNDQQLNKELKNKRKKERKKEETNSTSGALVVLPSAEWVALGEKWFEFAKAEMPFKSIEGSWTPVAFGKELERVSRALSVTPMGIEMILSFIEKDEFWRKNAISPFGLLKKGANGLRKIENIVAKMRTPQDRVQEAIKKFVNSPEVSSGIPF